MICLLDGCDTMFTPDRNGKQKYCGRQHATRARNQRLAIKRATDRAATSRLPQRLAYLLECEHHDIRPQPLHPIT